MKKARKIVPHLYSPHVPMVVGGVMAEGAHRATKFVDRNFVVRATRKLIAGRLPRKGYNVEITLTFGRPNYRERQFIKACVKAGEPFPVKKVQIKFPPKRPRK